MQSRLLVLATCAALAAACGSSSSDAPPSTDDSGSPAGDTPVGETPGGDSAKDTGGDAGCSTPLVDPLADKRTACTFAAGAKVADTIGGVDRSKLPIGHVIVMMKENRSYDHIFGALPKAGVTDAEPIPADFANPDKTGAAVPAFHQTDTCVKLDPEHQWDNQHASWDTGKNDGFVKNAADHSSDVDGKPLVTDGKFVMGHYEAAELPFYYWLAGNYSVADHYFCSALSGTWSNRLFLYAGSSYGVKVTAVDFAPDTVKGKTIFDALDKASVTWAIYTDDAAPLDYTLFTVGFDGSNPNVKPTAKFFSSLADGTLPQVVFIDSLANKEDEHPPADVQVGEAWSKKVYDAVTSSPLWLKDGKGVAMFYTYDENGSFADHVPPPTACAPSADLAAWDHLGFRVPFVLVSPFAKRHYVSHAVHSHTSIDRFIELLYDLPAMSARDANSDALLDMFDFGCPPSAAPTGAPSPGTGGCAIGGGDAGTDAPSDGG